MDISQREGKYPPPDGCSTILGVEFSGHVVDLGPGVSDWKLDDEVIGLVGGVIIRFPVFSTISNRQCYFQFPGCLRRIHHSAAEEFDEKAYSFVMGRSREHPGELSYW
jgi:hypothetical protein